MGADRGAGSRFRQSRGAAPEDAALKGRKKKRKRSKQISVPKYTETSSWLCQSSQELFC